ncbi:MAG: lipopolysaccharide core heptose(II) kinase RfaY [Akkermansiaceae bacterium]|nr:lipopolysaccharide core heptose(II) kinase RfaY [Akkermansiaceae bacterium]
MIQTRRHSQLSDTEFHALMQIHEEAYANGKTINQKGHQGVSECQIDGKDYMIKRYLTRSPFSSLRLWFGSSRIDTSFRYAVLLNDHDIAVAKHLLTVKHLSFSNSCAYLIMEKARGTALFEFIRADTNLTLNEIAIENIARLITGLHKHGIAHGDLHTRNLIIAEDNSVRLIDFDNARKSTSGILKDLTRFRNAIAKNSSYEPTIIQAMKRLGHPYLNN